MPQIEIGCFCGAELNTEMRARHDFGLNCEDMQIETMECAECGAKYRIWIGVDVLGFGNSD